MIFGIGDAYAPWGWLSGWRWPTSAGLAFALEAQRAQQQCASSADTAHGQAVKGVAVERPRPRPHAQAMLLRLRDKSSP